MNAVLTGGGTAGHIMPNMALLPWLKKDFDNIYYIGDARGAEKKICLDYGVEFFDCPSVKFDRSKILSNVKIPFVLPSCVKTAEKLLAKLDADVVFSKGGFVSLPPVLAARALRIPYICHESDASLGLANKIVAKKAFKVITAFEGVYVGANLAVIGNPVRAEIFEGRAQNVFHAHGIATNLPVLLILGGSLGSTAINEAVYAALDVLTRDYFVIHICGKNIRKVTHAGYVQLEYSDNINDYYALASIVVARCGAGVSSELTALNKRAVYVPLPVGASRGDQLLNARRLEQSGLATVLPQEHLSPSTLCDAVSRENARKKVDCAYDRAIPAKIASAISDAAATHVRRKRK